MNASAPRRLVVATFVALSALCVGLVSAHASPATVATQAAPVTTPGTTSTVLVPPVAPLSAPETPDPIRGQYRWMGYGSQPTSWPATDVYYRDQVYWGRLERTQGTYNFSYIDAGLAAAGAVKGKFGFRVMAYCPGCWMEGRTDKASFPPVTPTYLPTQPGTTIPAWNSEAFLSRWDALMAELGRRYANDPRLGYIDVGGYGKYGEWWVDQGGEHITDVNGLRMIKAVTRAFPTKHVLINTMTTIDFTLAALAANPNLGIRTDSLGAPGMYSMVTDPAGSRLREVWKTRPFLSEWATTGDPVAGRDQVTTYHVSTTSSHNMRLTYDQMTAAQKAAYEAAVKSAGYRYAVTRATVSMITAGQQFRVDLSINNAGSAPTYDPWTVRLVLKDASGNRVATLPMPVDLRKQLPGTTTSTVFVNAPSLATGTYLASIEAVDPSSYSEPMHWANGSRGPDGSYALGCVGVGVDVVSRLAGSNRYATSAAISAATFAPGVSVAYVAVGDQFPDALSGAPAGGVNHGPVLLVTHDAIPTPVQQELTRLKPARIVILGGTSMVSESVKAALTGSVSPS